MRQRLISLPSLLLPWPRDVKTGSSPQVLGHPAPGALRLGAAAQGEAHLRLEPSGCDGDKSVGTRDKVYRYEITGPKTDNCAMIFMVKSCLFWSQPKIFWYLKQLCSSKIYNFNWNSQVHTSSFRLRSMNDFTVTCDQRTPASTHACACSSH